MRCFPLALIIPVLLIVIPVSARAGNTSENLFRLIDARLELMSEVAAYKWIHHLDIEDAAREQTVLDAAAGDALRVNLDPAASRAFFETQIRAAKDIQAHWFDRYRSGEAPHLEMDLATEVRPRLLDLGEQILIQLALSAPVDDALKSGFESAVNVTGLPEATRNELFTSLQSVVRYPDRLAQVLGAGQLRVGSTGDYAPFTWRAGDRWEGADIVMARELATSLGVRLVLVQTSWPTLVGDLDAGRFDIAMGGISINTDRAQHGYFSHAYHRGGKTPVSRCPDAERLDAIEKIDQPGVRLIVNPGGTNERFVADHIKQAQVIVWPDNQTIFSEIEQGRADVMITDAIEVALVTHRGKLLCGTMPGITLTHQEKAYLLPPDDRWKEYVNTWLDLRLHDGTLKRELDHALNGH